MKGREQKRWTQKLMGPPPWTVQMPPFEWSPDVVDEVGAVEISGIRFERVGREAAKKGGDDR